MNICLIFLVLQPSAGRDHHLRELYKAKQWESVYISNALIRLKTLFIPGLKVCGLLWSASLSYNNVYLILLTHFHGISRNFLHTLDKQLIHCMYFSDKNFKLKKVFLWWVYNLQFMGPTRLFLCVALRHKSRQPQHYIEKARRSIFEIY